jgi:alkaline phosphatase D
MPKTPAQFHLEPLRTMVAVGAVGPHSVRLWMRAERPGTLRVRWWPENAAHHAAEAAVHIPEPNACDNTASIVLPDDCPHAPPLVPLRRYRFDVVQCADQRVIGEGRFETAPAHPAETPEHFSIALLSCHQPFTPRGHVTAQAVPMLQAARRCLERHHTKLVFTVGDQMYADYPARLSLFNERFFAQSAPAGRQRVQDCTPAEIRRLYQMRYRRFWNLAEWQALHATYPCYPILDDHEIVDNWGADPGHQTPEWQAVGAGARAAYFDYQAARVLPRPATLPDSLHYTVVYGPVALFVMDLRSGRRAGAGGQLFAPAQAAALQRFLHEHAATPLLGIVLSVPVVHLPHWAGRLIAHLPPEGEDYADRWAAGAHLRDRDHFLALLQAHQCRYPAQRLFLLSGDIHTGCVHEIRWENSDLRLYQLVSSAITHASGLLARYGARLCIQFTRRIATSDAQVRATVRFLRGVDGYTRNPYGGLNLGIIEVVTPAAGAAPTVRLLLYGHHRDEPVCVYRSPAL